MAQPAPSIGVPASRAFLRSDAQEVTQIPCVGKMRAWTGGSGGRRGTCRVKAMR